MGAHRCQRCGSAHLRRSRQKSFIEFVILPLFLVRPYRCEKCHARQLGIGFHRFRREVSSTLLAVLLIIVLVAALVGSLYLALAIITRL